jgi:hypothetical protein
VRHWLWVSPFRQAGSGAAAAAAAWLAAETPEAQALLLAAAAGEGSGWLEGTELLLRLLAGHPDGRLSLEAKRRALQAELGGAATLCSPAELAAPAWLAAWRASPEISLPTVGGKERMQA